MAPSRASAAASLLTINFKTAIPIGDLISPMISPVLWFEDKQLNVVTTQIFGGPQFVGVIGEDDLTDLGLPDIL